MLKARGLMSATCRVCGQEDPVKDFDFWEFWLPREPAPVHLVCDRRRAGWFRRLVYFGPRRRISERRRRDAPE